MPTTLPRFKPRPRDSHKGNFGRILLVGGSRGMAGSISLSAMAALKSGAGLVTAAVPLCIVDTVASFDPCYMTWPLADDGSGALALDAVPEIELGLNKFQAIGCGPGLGTRAGALALVKSLLRVNMIPRVLDADGLNALSQLANWTSMNQGALVLTPHPGELQRLTGVHAADRAGQIQAAMELSKAAKCVIVVKGAPTVVVNGAQTWENQTGNPGMATGGCGDVLTGIIATLLGQQLSPWDAARLAVHLHGAAGDLAAHRLGEIGMTARDVLQEVPQAFQNYLNEPTSE